MAKGAKGIILGSHCFADKKNKPEVLQAQRLLFDRYASLLEKNGIKIPIVYSDDFGHGTQNHVLPFGTKAVLTLDKGEATLDVATR